MRRCVTTIRAPLSQPAAQFAAGAQGPATQVLETAAAKATAPKAAAQTDAPPDLGLPPRVFAKLQRPRSLNNRLFRCKPVSPTGEEVFQ